MGSQSVQLYFLNSSFLKCILSWKAIHNYNPSPHLREHIEITCPCCCLYVCPGFVLTITSEPLNLLQPNLEFADSHGHYRHADACLAACFRILNLLMWCFEYLNKLALNLWISWQISLFLFHYGRSHDHTWGTRLYSLSHGSICQWYNTTLLSRWGGTFGSNMNTVKDQTSHENNIVEIIK